MNKLHLLRPLSQTLTLTLTRPFSFTPTTSNFSVKKVTKANFESALEDLKNHVRNADFVSVDLEMTGITSAPWRESFEFDRFDVQYLKVKDSVEKFAIIQLGVCPFRWDSSKQSFVAHPHTFYVFPRKELLHDGPAHEFLCQTSSLDFLARYQFDFNACIHEGISYLSRAQEAEALKRLKLAFEDELSKEGHAMKEVNDIPLVSIADILFTERMKNRFNEWRGGLLRNTSGGSQFDGNSIDTKAQLETVFFNMRPALKFNGYTSHQLRMIQLVIKKYFKDLAYVNVKGEESFEQKLVVYVDSDEDKHLLMKEATNTQHKEAEVQLNAAVGIRHVIELLCSEQKLIVGHNSFLDIAHIYNKFFGPLPSTIEDFASSVHESFPHIIDTKYILNNDLVIHNKMKKKSRSLSSAFSFLCPEIASSSTGSTLDRHSRVKVEVQVDEMSSSNWNSGAKHEAGYDAFMTGCVFAQACSHIGIDFQLHSPSTSLTHHEKLQKYINILYTSWNNGAIVELSTGNPSIESSGYHRIKQRHSKVEFQNVVLLWGFSPKVKPRELKECLAKVFGLTAVIAVYYLDVTAAFVQFNKEELVHAFLDLKETLDQRNDAISVLHPLAKLLEGGNTQASDYETYKEICGSLISRTLFSDQAEAVGIRRKNKGVESREEAEVSSDESNTEQRRHNTAKYQSCKSFSPADLVDALRGAESKLDKQVRTSNF